MKLAAHYNKASIIITVSVLFVGAIIYFIAINYISGRELDRELSEEVEELIHYVQTNNQLPSQIDFGEYRTEIEKLHIKINEARYFDTIYSNPKNNLLENARAVEMPLLLQGQYYKAVISISKQSTTYLIQIIALITVILIMSLLLAVFVINRYVLKRLWKPFYELLAQAKAYKINENNVFKLSKSKVDEFVELNGAMNEMSSRVKNDFQNLKQFTENASHEIMTPLSVITSKLDTLIQDETLSPAQYDQINDIYVASGRLSRLNQSLLLLVKIENNLLADAELLSIDVIIFEKLRQFNELINSRQLSVMEAMINRWTVSSKYLMDILFNNLFSNAIRHNVTNGSIIIKLGENSLLFQNTGDQTPLNPHKVFNRFQKSKSSEGYGLGLTIIKNICTLYNWNLSYSYGGMLHTFQIDF